MDWIDIKTFVEHAGGISHDALHVVLGVLIQLLAVALTRWTLGHAGPVLLVFALELLNEWNDLSTEQWPDPAMQYGEGAKDLLLTMILPIVLFAVSRWAPQLVVRPAADEPPVPTDDAAAQD